MKKLTWGIVLMVCGVMFVLSAGQNPDGPAGSVGMGVLSLAGGAALAYHGWRFRARRRTVIDSAFQMLRETSAIKSRDLAVAVGVSELEVRQHIAEAQRAGLIPLKADVV